MDKRHGQYLLGMYDAVITDCTRAFPNLAKELKRDLSRLHSSVESRGLRVITLDLPLMGKEFDLSLHNGRLTLSAHCLTSRRWKGSPIPKLFSGLMMRVFDASGVLRDDADTEAIRFLRQLYNLAKKWRVPCADHLVFEEVREYFRIDEQLPRPSTNWDWGSLFSDEPITVDFNELYARRSDMHLPLFEEESSGVSLFTGDPVRCRLALDTLQRVCDIVTTTLGSFEGRAVVAKHGPGVVSDLKRGISKYEFPNWPERLEQVFPMAEFAFANLNQWADSVQLDDGMKVRFNTPETYSRLIAVPKTQKGPRLIAAEPTAHQWCQQLVRRWMYERVSQSWLSASVTFNDQRPNQDLAKLASKVGGWSTIDLSSASDRMTCYVVERAFRKNPFLLDAFMATRTRIIRNPIDKKSGEFHFLRKFSTMGSALTFPVQTLIFLSVALTASYLVHFGYDLRVTAGKLKALSRGIRVFGDDIVVPDDSAKCTVELLQYLFFKVNTSKTFTGPSRFRESCGVEAYDGVDVTPSYALTLPRRSAPDSYVSCVAMAHNFFSKKLFATADYLRRTLAHDKSFNLPWVECGSGNFGWPSPFGFDVGTCKTRFNKELQRMEYRTRLVINKPRRAADRGPSRLLQYFTEAPLPNINWASGVVVNGRTLTRSVWVPLPK